ncbi:MAG: helix-turn-helix transcriptional regulator [Bacilli bacterium]
MTIEQMMLQQKMTKYRLSKVCGIPYSTIADICSGKTKIENCSFDKAYKISKALNVSLDYLYEQIKTERVDFDLFRSNVCHRLKQIGDKEMMLSLLREDKISLYYEKGFYLESFYLLALLDYLSAKHSVSLCKKYSVLRTKKLKNRIYPASIYAISEVAKTDQAKKEALKNAIPEFKRFNIIENDLYDVA